MMTKDKLGVKTGPQATPDVDEHVWISDNVARTCGEWHTVGHADTIYSWEHIAANKELPTAVTFTSRHVASMAWRWWYIGPVAVGNVGDNSLSCYRLHASETQQLSHVPTADATPICVELLGHSRQPMTGRLATHPSNTSVKI